MFTDVVIFGIASFIQLLMNKQLTVGEVGEEIEGRLWDVETESHLKGKVLKNDTFRTAGEG
jgi:hypothetical protein